MLTFTETQCFAVFNNNQVTRQITLCEGDCFFVDDGDGWQSIHYFDEVDKIIVREVLS